MDYTKIYNQIIERSKTEVRARGCSTYYEAHHIIPRCLGGSNAKANITLLTAREHFLCHWLLHRIHPTNTKLTHAFFMMCYAKGKGQYRYTPSSRALLEAKKALAAVRSKTMKGSNNPMYGKKRPDLSLYNSTVKRGVPSGKKGIPKPNVSGELHPMYGKHHTPDARRKMSETKKGVPQPRLMCPHCGTVGGNSNMKRYHFNRCKKFVFVLNN